MTIEIPTIPVTSIRQLADPTGKRRTGLLYFWSHRGHAMPRILTARTDAAWLNTQIAAGTIHIPTETVTAELS